MVDEPAPSPATAWVLHVDLDQFLAAVEVARHPELAGRPVVVGGKGDPTQRAVVATASYEARRHGVHSGMPLRTAAKRCPDAVFLPSDPPAYDEASEQVMEALRTLPVVVEVLGWDEAFLGPAPADPTRSTEPVDPEALAAEVRRTVKEATGLDCSVGIGDTRLRAKIATGFAKPAGVFRLTRRNWVEVMAHRPTEALWGIGTKTGRKLVELGIATVGELSRSDPDVLAARFGPTMGPWYRLLSIGGGGAQVSAEPYVPKSRSRETTFQENVDDRAVLEEHLIELAERVAEDVAGEGRPAVRVAVKVRFVPFFTQTRSVALPAPTQDPEAIRTAAHTALARLLAPSDDDSGAVAPATALGPNGPDPDRLRPIRLLGVRADLAPPGGDGT
jgi:DNA polymerase-4